MSVPSIEGAASLDEETRTLVTQPLFHTEAHIDANAWPLFEDHVPQLPWLEIRCDVAELASCFPDCLLPRWGLMVSPMQCWPVHPDLWHHSYEMRCRTS
eukprot:4529804-Amphidinium_carterae.2